MLHVIPVRRKRVHDFVRKHAVCIDVALETSLELVTHKN